MRSAMFLVLVGLACIWSGVHSSSIAVTFPATFAATLMDKLKEGIPSDSDFDKCFFPKLFPDSNPYAKVDYVEAIDSCMQKTTYSKAMPFMYAFDFLITVKIGCLNFVRTKEGVPFQVYALSLLNEAVPVKNKEFCDNFDRDVLAPICEFDKACEDETSHEILDSLLTVVYSFRDIHATIHGTEFNCPAFDIKIDPKFYHYGLQSVEDIKFLTKRLACPGSDL